MKNRPLFEHMADGFTLNEIIVDSVGIPIDYRVLDANPVYLFRNGLVREQVIGKTMSTIFPGSEPCGIEVVGRVAQTGNPEVFEYCSAISNRTYQVRAFSPSLGQFAALYIDITDKKRLETEHLQSEEAVRVKNLELERMNEEKDKFYSVLAHDLKNPFNALLGLTEILADNLQEMPMKQAREIAKATKSSASKIYTLLTSLLEWSKVNQGLIPFSPETLTLHSVIEENKALLQDLAAHKSISILTDFPIDLKVVADHYMLQSIIRNLMTNALKYTPHNGQITISASVDPRRGFEITISDTGIGMSRTIMENLFKPDYKTGRSGTDGETSTGLGLLICKEFVRIHGGNLSVESEVSKGSRFTLTLPIRQVTSRVDLTLQPQEQPSGLSRKAGNF